MIRKTVVIDAFPESADRYQTGYAVVAIDVIRATTTAVTAIATGRRCFPVVSEEEALLLASRLVNPLLAGELHGDMLPGFDLNNSPVEVESRDDIDRPIVLLSSSGTRLIRNLDKCDAAYLACFRNYAAVARHLITTHRSVALIGAGSRDEFREEDQMCCAWIALLLIGCGYTPANSLTSDIVRAWAFSQPADCLTGNSAAYLRNSGQLADLDFVVSRINDLDMVCHLAGDEVVRTGVLARKAG